MKKQTIWIIAIALMVAFAGLIVMQSFYLAGIVKTREEQFDEAVKRSLWSIQRQLERRETQEYLNEYYDDSERQLLNSLSHDDFSLLPPVDSFPPNIRFNVPGSHDYNKNRQQAMQEMMLQQFVYQRDLLDDVAFRILSQTADKPILERLDVNDVYEDLTNEIQHAGYNLRFEFAIVDKDGSLAYHTLGFKSDEAEKYGSYMQVLFPRSSHTTFGDIQTKISYLEVYFPDSHKVLLSSGLHFMIPSFIFSTVILIIFLFVIIVIFRSKKLSEMKNDFINNMTHEFKTPISSISLASQMLNDPAVSKSPDMVKHITGVIADETKRLRFQVEKVLQMSMFDRQKTNLKLQDIPVNALIDSATSTFRLKVEKAGGTIETHLDAEDDICMIDEMHFGNVIFNLMDNAYKYACEDRPLHLNISTRNLGEKSLELRVSDNGIGIKKEDLKRIFEKFYRVSTGNVHNVKGFGLGLAYVWKIVHDHGGDIKAESDYGKGTTFIITIPLLND